VETGGSLKFSDEVILDMAQPDSTQGSASTPLVCHVSPTYSSIEAPSPTLSQGSSISLSGPPPQPPPACQVIVSTVCGHTTMTPPVQVQAKSGPIELLSTMGPLGEGSHSQTSGGMPPPMHPPAHMPPSASVASSSSPCLLMNPNMMVPVGPVGVPQGPVSSSSHCIMPATGMPPGNSCITYIKFIMNVLLPTGAITILMLG